MEILPSPPQAPPASPSSRRKGGYGLSPALERLFMNPSLLCCSFNGRVYVYSRDIVPHPNEEEILGIYEQARKAAEEFRAHFNEKSQFFRQRKAQKTVIFSTHQTWKIDLESHFERFLEASNLPRNYYKYNPLMKEPAHIEKALASNMSLNSWTLPLMSEYRDLIELLHSEQYAAIVEIYKDLKKKCKLLMGKKTIEERVDELASIIQEAEDKIASTMPKLADKKEAVKEQSLLIYIELLIFIKYTSYIIQGKTLPIRIPKTRTEESPFQADPSSPISAEDSVNGDVPSLDKPSASSWLSLSWLWPISSRFLTSSAVEESARNFADLPALDKERLTLRLEVLMGKIVLMEKKIYQEGSHVSQEEDPLEGDLALAADFVKTANLQKFPSEDEFRNGKSFVTAPFVGPYRDIRPQVVELTKIAKAVVKLQETTLLLMSKLNQGSLEEHNLKSVFPDCELFQNPSLHDIKNHCRRIIGGIELLIEEQGKALLQLPYINSVPEGLYYVANLFAKAREVRMYIDLFETMIDDNYILYPKSLAALRAYLDSIKSGSLNPEDFQRPEALMGLYQAAALASKLKKPAEIETVSQKLEALAYPQIDEILAKVGPRTLALSDEESKAAAGILTKLPLSTFWEEFESDIEEKRALLPGVIITALTKALMKQTLFSKRGIAPELDVMLCVLENQLDYAAAFQDTLKSLPWFDNLLAEYRLQSDLKNYVKECLLMGKTLNFFNHPPGSFIEKVFSYCQAMQIYREIRSKNNSAQHEKRVQWFKEKTSPFFIQVQKDLPESFDETFFYPLAASLYADDPKEKREGTDFLLTKLGQCEQQELPQERALCLLLYKWILEHSRSEEIKNIPHGQYLLSQFFERYLNDQTERSLWRMEFCIDFLEIILKKFIEIESQNQLGDKKILEAVREKRTMEGYDEWLLVLNFYEQFQSVLVELNNLIALSSSSEEVISKISELRIKAGLIAATAADKVPKSLGDTVVNEFIDIEDPSMNTFFENPQTHFEISRWFCEKMRRQLTQFLFAKPE